MLIPNMCHQTHNIFYFVAEKVTQNLKDFSNSRDEILPTLIAILHYLEAKIDYSYFIISFVLRF